MGKRSRDQRRSLPVSFSFLPPHGQLGSLPAGESQLAHGTSDHTLNACRDPSPGCSQLLLWDRVPHVRFLNAVMKALN